MIRFRWPSNFTAHEKLGLSAIAVGVLLFGVILEVRINHGPYSPSDFPVYSRAAWEVRTGGDLYAVTDEHGWHYVYPPLTAILLVPLAEPPAIHRHLADPASNPQSLAPETPERHHHAEVRAPPGAYLPRSVSVGIWYVLGVVLLTLGIFALARALEENVPGLLPNLDSRIDRNFSWGLRGLPILISLGAILTNLGRGQMEAVTLSCFCFAIAGLIRGKNFRAGMLLALPICIKLVPVLLLVYPLWRRNFRCLAGAAVGLLLGLIVIPVAAMGPQRALDAYWDFKKVMVDPSLGRGSDTSRQHELVQMSQGDTQSLMSVFQNTRYFNVPREQRPPHADRDVWWAATLISIVMLAITVAVTGFRRRDPALAVVLFIGCLLLVMLVATPVSHSHYWGLLAPLAMGMLAWESLAQKRLLAGVALSIAEWRLRIAVWVSLGLCFAFDVIDRLPHIDKPMRDLGFATYCTVFAWAVAVIILRQVVALDCRQSADTSAHIPAN